MSEQTDGEIESICQKTVFHCISATKKIVFFKFADFRVMRVQGVTSENCLKIC